MPGTNTESLISSALSKVKHRNPEQTKRDVLAALHHYRGLIPKPDKFIFNDGANRDMINIFGTIPVPYKGQNYNIPVSLWLLETHPYHAPLCYVKPTSDMQIKVSKHVDQSGKIYLPYLHEWNSSSDLLGLIQILIVTFSEQPPVYSRPKSQDPPPPTSSQPVNYPVPVAVYPTNIFPPGYGAGGGGGGQCQQYSPGYSSPTQFSYQRAVTTPPPQHSEEGQGARQAVEEEVRARLRDEIARKQAETEELVKVGEKLSEGNSRLSLVMSRLQQELAETESQVDLIRRNNEQMRGERERLTDSLANLDCNEAVTATAPLYNQLLEAHAEDAAIEDAVYFLGESLRRGVIDSELFLKHVRNLSRKQFLLRATMLKCRKVGGLKV